MRQGAGQNAPPRPLALAFQSILPLNSHPVSSSACLLCGHCHLPLLLTPALLPSTSQPGPSALLAPSPHRTPALGSPTAAALGPQAGALPAGGRPTLRLSLSVLHLQALCPPRPQSPAEKRVAACCGWDWVAGLPSGSPGLLSRDRASLGRACSSHSGLWVLPDSCAWSLPSRALAPGRY